MTAGRSGRIDGARGSDSAVLGRVLRPGGPGAESLRPAQVRHPIPSVPRGGGSLCKRIRPGPPSDRLAGKAKKTMSRHGARKSRLPRAANSDGRTASEHSPPYEGGARGGEVEAMAYRSATPKNPPVSPLRKGGRLLLSSPQYASASGGGATPGRRAEWVSSPVASR